MTALTVGSGASIGAENDLSDLNELDPAPPEAARSKKFEWSQIIGPAVTTVVFIMVWHYMHSSGMRYFFDKPGFLLPAPETVINDSFINATARGSLLNGLKWTAVVATIGLLIAIVLGMAVAVLMAQAKWAERSMYPYLIALQAIPVLAVVPVIAAVFPTGMAPRLFVCVMISIFPIVTNTLFGLTSADVGQHDLFTLRGASRWTRLMKLQFPAAMPAIFTGFRISAGLSVIGAVVGEQFFRGSSKAGLGIVMEQYRQKIKFPQIYGGLVLTASLGIAVFFLFGYIGNLVIGHWYDNSRKTN